MNANVSKMSEVPMSPTTRSMIRTSTVILGLLVGGVWVVLAVRSASGLSITEEGHAYRATQLWIAGELLLGVGVAGAFTVCAVCFRNWSSMFPRVPGGLRGLRRARRQVNGEEPYRADEVAHLRRYAERESSPFRSPAAHWLLWVCVFATTAAMVLMFPLIALEH